MLGEHLPPELALVLRALGHEAIPARETELRGHDDGFLVRNLGAAGVDWLITLDQYREPEVWADVYAVLAEQSGRLVRIRPTRPARRQTRAEFVADLTRYLVDSYAAWSRWLDDRAIRLIDLGRTSTRPARRSGGRGAGRYSAYDREEVAALTQQRLGTVARPRSTRRRVSRGPARA